MRGGSHIARAFLILFLTGSIGTAVAATRESGLSVHMLPDRVARSIGGHGGFTVTDPPTRQRGTTYAHPEELLTYFQGLPASVRQNGIWIVTIHPSSYSESEQARLKTLPVLCAERKIAIYTRRASELPESWRRLE